MVLDSSAIVAVRFREPGYESFTEKLEASDIKLIGTPTVLETAMVLSARTRTDARPELYSFLRYLDVEILPFNEHHMDAAINAFLRFGRGRHRASLNFGDCLSYAVASVADLPLLFTGNDFRHTDIAPA